MFLFVFVRVNTKALPPTIDDVRRQASASAAAMSLRGVIEAGPPPSIILFGGSSFYSFSFPHPPSAASGYEHTTRTAI
jgi:hypothetical protein